MSPNYKTNVCKMCVLKSYCVRLFMSKYNVVPLKKKTTTLNPSLSE